MNIADMPEYQVKYRELHAQGLTNKAMLDHMPMCYAIIVSIGRKLGLEPIGGSGWGGKRQRSELSNCKKVVRSDGVIFDSAKEAAKITGVIPDGISRCCRGKRKLCGGYGWRFLEGM